MDLPKSISLRKHCHQCSMRIIYNLINHFNMKSIICLLAVITSLILHAQQVSAQSTSDTTQKATVTVMNLTCDGDMPTIKKRLLNQDGIESVAFSPRNAGASHFTISFLGTVISLEQIRKTIESTPGCDDKNTTPYRVKKARPSKDDKS